MSEEKLEYKEDWRLFNKGFKAGYEYRRKEEGKEVLELKEQLTDKDMKIRSLENKGGQ